MRISNTGAQRTDELMKHRTPEKFNDLVLKIKYFNEDRIEHITLLRNVDGELINEKASN